MLFVCNRFSVLQILLFGWETAGLYWSVSVVQDFFANKKKYSWLLAFLLLFRNYLVQKQVSSEPEYQQSANSTEQRILRLIDWILFDYVFDVYEIIWQIFDMADLKLCFLFFVVLNKFCSWLRRATTINSTNTETRLTENSIRFWSEPSGKIHKTDTFASSTTSPVIFIVFLFHHYYWQNIFFVQFKACIVLLNYTHYFTKS